MTHLTKQQQLEKEITTFSQLYADLHNAKRQLYSASLSFRINQDGLLKRLAIYMFNREPTKISTIKNLSLKNKSVPKIPPEYIEFLDECIGIHKKCYDDMTKCRREYWQIHKKCNHLKDILCAKLAKYFNDNTKKTFMKYLSKQFFSDGTKKPSVGEQKIMACLDDISREHRLYYFYSYRWDFCRKDKLPLEYDFYCVLIDLDNVSFVQFIIEFDGEQHSDASSLYNNKNIHVHDLLKQYYLREMNIHLLRLTGENHVGRSIRKFINDVSKTTKYMAVNAIKPDGRLLGEKVNVKSGLHLFYKFYRGMYEKYYLDKDKAYHLGRFMDANDDNESVLDVINDNDDLWEISDEI